MGLSVSPPPPLSQSHTPNTHDLTHTSKRATYVLALATALFTDVHGEAAVRTHAKKTWTNGKAAGEEEKEEGEREEEEREEEEEEEDQGTRV